MSKIIKGKLYTNPKGLIVKATSNSEGKATFDGIMIEDPQNLFPNKLNKNSKNWNTFFFEEYNTNNDLFPIY